MVKMELCGNDPGNFSCKLTVLSVNFLSAVRSHSRFGVLRYDI